MSDVNAGKGSERKPVSMKLTVVYDRDYCQHTCGHRHCHSRHCHLIIIAMFVVVFIINSKSSQKPVSMKLTVFGDRNYWQHRCGHRHYCRSRHCH
jgi:hypothetical protein